MPLTSITAWEGLFERLGFSPEANSNSGKSILIIGGAGGVGSIAIQLTRWAGLKMFASAPKAVLFLLTTRSNLLTSQFSN